MTLSSVFHTGPLRRLLSLLGLSLLAASCHTPQRAAGLNEDQIAVLRDIGFHQEGDNWGFDLDIRILFGSNDAELSEHNRETIARVVKSLRKIGVTRLNVEGHSDNTGNKLYNEKLSLRRAQSVAHEIARNGLPYRNITLKGYGVDNPVSDNATREGRAQNRRVVIIVPVE
ncbi:MAG: OmpA family protein [Azoarcus sp.]|jgi:outer membrane protein OmpA-like peptidoglycan-associated protein|nr:OmpA family protein [Azoarcus sp.]